MASIDDVDLAVVSPCPAPWEITWSWTAGLIVDPCGLPVRRMGGVPIAGPSTDPIVSGPWWCPLCLQAKTTAAADAVRARTAAA